MRLLAITAIITIHLHTGVVLKEKKKKKRSWQRNCFFGNVIGYQDLEESVLLSVWCCRFSLWTLFHREEKKKKRKKNLKLLFNHCRPDDNGIMTLLRRCSPITVLLPACLKPANECCKMPYKRFPLPDWFFSLTDWRAGLSRGAVGGVLWIHSPMGTFWSAILRSNISLHEHSTLLLLSACFNKTSKLGTRVVCAVLRWLNIKKKKKTSFPYPFKKGPFKMLKGPCFTTKCECDEPFSKLSCDYLYLVTSQVGVSIQMCGG